MKVSDATYNLLTDEQKKAVDEAQSPEELLAMAKTEGYELTAEQMEAISGGEDSPAWGGGCDHDFEPLGTNYLKC